MKNLLILHGAIGSKSQFNSLASLLNNQFNIHLLNFSGHGGEAFKENFNIPQFADDVLVYLEQQKVESIDIFGYSMGGYVALYLAKNHPEKVNKIITLGTKLSWTPDIAAKETKMLVAEKMEEKIPAFAEILKTRHHPNYS
jgi:pimeloyl-ACP methyl ester carboxylesterase|tara:strand:- start:45721 stop:46143 length:423 start_codon:yes stop_codon:yes gene_type:complete